MSKHITRQNGVEEEKEEGEYVTFLKTELLGRRRLANTYWHMVRDGSMSMCTGDCRGWRGYERVDGGG